MATGRTLHVLRHSCALVTVLAFAATLTGCKTSEAVNGALQTNVSQVWAGPSSELVAAVEVAPSASGVALVDAIRGSLPSDYQAAYGEGVDINRVVSAPDKSLSWEDQIKAITAQSGLQARSIGSMIYFEVAPEAAPMAAEAPSLHQAAPSVDAASSNAQSSNAQSSSAQSSNAQLVNATIMGSPHGGAKSADAPAPLMTPQEAALLEQLQADAMPDLPDLEKIVPAESPVVEVTSPAQPEAAPVPVPVVVTAASPTPPAPVVTVDNKPEEILAQTAPQTEAPTVAPSAEAIIPPVAPVVLTPPAAVEVSAPKAELTPPPAPPAAQLAPTTLSQTTPAPAPMAPAADLAAETVSTEVAPAAGVAAPQLSAEEQAVATTSPITPELTGAVGSTTEHPAATGATWSAQRGQTLRAVLEQWCDREGVELNWATSFDYPLQASVTINDTFENAVRTLLTGFTGASPQPFGRLHRQANAGSRLLIIETRGNRYED